MSITIGERATPWEPQKYRTSTPGKTATPVSGVRRYFGLSARKVAAESLAQGGLER
jgi:hypothetical protein